MQYFHSLNEVSISLGVRLNTKDTKAQYQSFIQL